MQRENEQSTSDLFTTHTMVMVALVLLLFVCGWLIIKNRIVPSQPPPTTLDLEREEIERQVAEEAQLRQEKLEDARREKQILDEQRMTQRTQAEVEAAIQRSRILAQRKILLAQAQKCRNDLEHFERHLQELLTNEDGKRLASSPRLIGQYLALREKARPTISEVEIISEAIPEEQYYEPPDMLLYVPPSVDTEKLEGLRATLTALGDHLLSHRLELKEMLAVAANLELGQALEKAIPKWQEVDEKRRVDLARQTAAQGEIVAPGAYFYGFYQFTELRSHRDVKKDFFKLTIQRRIGNGFNAVFKLAWQDWPAEGQMNGNQITLRAYQHKESRDDRQFDRAFFTFTGEVHGITLSGEFHEPVKENPGRGHFYAQLVEGDRYMDIVNTPKDILAPGAIWKGMYRSVSPERGDAKEFTVLFESRNRTSFTALLKPQNSRFVSGKIDGSKLTWFSDSGKGPAIKYEATKDKNQIKGTASVIVDGIHHRSEFEMEFDKISPRFWASRR